MNSDPPQNPSPIITLTTDFGHQDPFVGILHGVIMARWPTAKIVDLCHEIGPQDVLAGAFWWAASWRWFPSGSVHVAVIDPGVGTDRRALAVRLGGQFFLAPDNGLLSGILVPGVPAEVRQIDPQRLGLTALSRTFHGRDLFAPAAALLASGATRFEDVGPKTDHWTSLSGLTPTFDARTGSLRGTVITLDRFGNLITNLAPLTALERERPCPVLWVKIRGMKARVVGTYAEAGPGELVAILNSLGTYELALRNGSAAGLLGVGRGEPVEAGGGIGS